MSLNYNWRYDRVYSELIDTKGIRVYTNRYICFGNCLSYTIIDHLKSKDVQYYDYYWCDRVSQHYKSHGKINEFINIMRDCGVLRNAEITLLDNESINKDTLVNISEYYKDTGYYFRLRFDVTKCTAQEMFFVGGIFRTISNSPRIIRDFLRLYKLHGKEKDPSHLFMIAHAVSWTKRPPSQAAGHAFMLDSFVSLTGRTFADYLKHLDKGYYPVIKTSSRYSTSEGVQAFFVTRVLKGIVYNIYKSSIHFNRSGGVKYAKEVIESFFDVEVFKKNYQSVCRNPTKEGTFKFV